MLIDPKLVGKRTKLNFKVIRTLSCSVKLSLYRRKENINGAWAGNWLWGNSAILRPAMAD